MEGGMLSVLGGADFVLYGFIRGTTRLRTCTRSAMKTHRAMLHFSAGVGFITERPLSGTERGVLKRFNGAIRMIVEGLVFLLMVPSLSLCAPQIQKLSSDVVPTPDLANPFGSSEDNLRLLQSFIKSTLRKVEASPELNTREQEVFFLFSLYDYDRSGQMDGLELMQLLTDFLSYHTMMPESTDSVVSLVDYLLQSQDLNQDGLLAPSELLSSATLDHHDAPAKPVEEALAHHDQTDTEAEGGDSEPHQQKAEVEDNQETEQKQEQELENAQEQENETQNLAQEEHKQAEELADENQIPESVKEQQDHLQPPEEQDLDHQG